MNNTNASANLNFNEANARVTELMCGRVVDSIYRDGHELIIALQNGHHVVLEANSDHDICFKKLKVNLILNSVSEVRVKSKDVDKLTGLLRGQTVDCVMRKGKELIIVCVNGCQVTIASNINYHIVYKSHETRVYMSGLSMGAMQGAVG